MSSSASPAAPGRAGAGVRRGGGRTRQLLRLFALLSVASLLWQFVTAGRLLGQDGQWAGLHAAGAVALHVVTGVTALLAVLHQRATLGPWWPSALAVVVFVLTFVQAATGGYAGLAVHVPGALVVTTGTVWLAAWASTAARAGPAPD